MKVVMAAAIQFTDTPGDVAANWAHVRSALERAGAEGAQLVVLPEMWSTGFAYRQLNQLAQGSEALLVELQQL